MRTATRALALSIALAAVSAPALAAPPVWVIRDRDSTITLFGSVHVLPRGLDWTPPALERALAKADDLWFELPLDDATAVAVQRESVARGFLQRGQRLSALLSPRGSARLAKVSAGLGLSATDLDRMRPWYAELTLSSAVYRLSGADASQGVDRQISAAAPKGVRRVALETPRQQIAMFDGAPLRDQVASLEQTLRQIERSPGDYDGLVRAWMAGDVRAIERQSLRPLRAIAPRLYAGLVVRRNAVWTGRIIERLRGSGNTVIVVGVGHLAGADGVPARLRAMGIRVEGPR